MKLYKLETKIGTYWTIAEHPTEAEQKVTSILNERDYGYTDDRKVTSIIVVAEAIEDYLTDKFLVL